MGSLLIDYGLDLCVYLPSNVFFQEKFLLRTANLSLTCSVLTEMPFPIRVAPIDHSGSLKENEDPNHADQILDPMSENDSSSKRHCLSCYRN